MDAQFLPSRGLPATPLTDSSSVSVSRAYGRDLDLTEEPRLSYLRTPEGKGYLVWRSRVEYTDKNGGPQVDDIFVDAITGELVEKHPLVHSALSRRTYTASNGTSLPGTLLISEGGSSSDTGVQTTYNYAGSTYAYYSNTHARDSWNDTGGFMNATAHYRVNYNNAHWDGSLRLAYFGDGDGYNYDPWYSLDVVGHEFTHGVTQTEANLTYQNESGAVNESMSDIFGAMIERSVTGLGANTWLVGEDVGVFAGPLRSMSDPAAIFPGKDYYPDRYTGTDDSGGVHRNSGISNLAFYLLSQGGTHPRGKTTINVPSIGYAKAETIFYRSLCDYLLSNDGFYAAGNKTEDFAKTQYGLLSQELKSTCAAWNAVGVPDNRLNCPEPNANLLAPGTITGNQPEDICYGWNYHVSWSSVTDATSYKLMRSSSAGDFTIASVPYTGANTFTGINMGNNNNIAYVRVAACNANGCSALSSNYATVYGTNYCY